MFRPKMKGDPPLFTGQLLIKFQNILRNTTQVIIRHRVKILFSVISSPITLERQKWKSSKMIGEEDPCHFWWFSLLPFQSYWTWYDGKYDFYPMSYDNLSNVSQNVLKFYQICLQTDGRQDGRTWWNQYTPLQLRCEGYNKTWWKQEFIRISSTVYF
jgi:hypothetical protein